jgi:hypothetical protein
MRLIILKFLYFIVIMWQLIWTTKKIHLVGFCWVAHSVSYRVGGWDNIQQPLHGHKIIPHIKSDMKDGGA